MRRSESVCLLEGNFTLRALNVEYGAYFGGLCGLYGCCIKRVPAFITLGSGFIKRIAVFIIRVTGFITPLPSSELACKREELYTFGSNSRKKAFARALDRTELLPLLSV